jgi:DNA-binding winged helix-turn-helix (wHTH) protein/Tfp pilus assembly protein PilF
MRNYQFENFLLECGAHRLWLDGKIIRLSSKLFDLLRYLIENRSRIVSQDELLHHVWAGLSVEANNVRVTINQLRLLLNDKVAEPKFIATIPKSGYRFIATIAEIATENSSSLSSIQTNEIPKQKETIEAEQLYLKAQRLIESHEPHSFEKGVHFLREAVLLDPYMTKAWVGIANSYIYLGTFHISSPHSAFPVAEEALQKALAIDPKFPTALASFGNIKLMYHWQGKEAAKLLKQAVRLAPNFALVHYQLGLLGIMSGNATLAIDCMRKAIEIEPLLFPASTGLAQALGLAGRMDEAREVMHKIIFVEEQLNFGHYYLSRIYLNEGKLEEALAAAERACELLRHPMTFGLHGYINARMGEHKKAREILHQMKKLSKRKFLSPYYLAEVYLGLGDFERAMPCLEQAYDMRMAQLFRLRFEPTFSEIIQHKRLAPFISRIKLS